jgi:predicted metal-binding membrane protein
VLDVVSRRVVATVAVCLLLSAVAAWALTVRQASEMAGMASGLAHVGAAMPIALTAPAFTAMWVGMTAAMMFPTVVRMVAAHRFVTRRRGDGPVATVVFVLGYLMAWTGCWRIASGSAARVSAPVRHGSGRALAHHGGRASRHRDRGLPVHRLEVGVPSHLP